MFDARPHPFKLGSLALCAAATLFCASAMAAGTGAAASAQAQYKADVALCNSSQATQDRKNCMLEASRALAENRRNGLNTSGSLQGNASQRCDVLKGDDRVACEGRMRGQGSVEGSVAGGGLIRESVTTVPAK
jgi:hypothetical protein